MRTHVIFVSLSATALVLGLASAVAMEAATGWEFKSRAAQAAKRRYEEAIGKAEEEFAHRKNVARDAARKDLSDALRAATKAGDFDEGSRIKDALKQLDGLEVARPSRNEIIGRWKVAYTNGHRATVDIGKDGTITWSGGGRLTRGKVHRVGTDILAKEDVNDVVERLTLSGDRLLFEHFRPGSKYSDDNADIMGVAARVKATQ
jgi:hypothetical protein